jgi:hypothetical protein
MKRLTLTFAALLVAGVAGYFAVTTADAHPGQGDDINVTGYVYEASTFMKDPKAQQGDAERKLIEEGQPMMFHTERNATYTLFFANNGDKAAMRKKALECVGKLSILRGRDFAQWNYHAIEIKEIGVK